MKVEVVHEDPKPPEPVGVIIRLPLAEAKVLAEGPKYMVQTYSDFHAKLQAALRAIGAIR